MIERQGHLPGYTGHIPKMNLVEEPPQLIGPRAHIPNYQGFIPGVKSENLFGRTYGEITEESALGTYNKGKDIPTEEKFKSIAMDNYTNQMRIPVMPLKPKEYPPDPLDPMMTVPEEALNRFYGVGQGFSINEMEEQLYNFYGDEGEVRAEEGFGEDMAMATSSFFGHQGAEIPVEERLTYAEARELANRR